MSPCDLQESCTAETSRKARRRRWEAATSTECRLEQLSICVGIWYLILLLLFDFALECYTWFTLSVYLDRLLLTIRIEALSVQWPQMSLHKSCRTSLRAPDTLSVHTLSAQSISTHILVTPCSVVQAPTMHKQSEVFTTGLPGQSTA